MFSKDQQEQNAAMLDMDLQHEEVLAFFQDYWKQILAIAVFLIALTGIIQAYRAWDTRTAAEQTAEMLPLAEAPGTAQNAKVLEDFAKDKASGNRRVLAWLFAAGKYETANKPDDVRRVLGEVANSSAPKEIREYARLMAANAGGDAAALDSIGKDSPWYAAALELHALSQTDPEKRRELYGEIADNKNLPTALHQRAVEFSGESDSE